MKEFSLGLDIGGTKCAVILGRGEIPEKCDETFIIDKIIFPTNQPRGWEAVMFDFFNSIDTILNRNGISSDNLIGIGISCGGPLDSVEGVIKCPPNLPDWDEVPICSLLRKKYGVKVNLQNDANACAIAEWRFGAGRGYNNLIFLTFGTGMGAGLILNGRLYSGTNDMAGEVGHIRLEKNGPEGYGKSGSFEGFCSGGGLARLAKALLSEHTKKGGKSSLSELAKKSDGITAKSVAMAAREGDELALKVYKICGDKLGQGLAILIDILNPEAVIIGSIFERSGDLMIDSVKKTLRKEALSHSLECCKIIPAMLGDSIGDFAALGVAFA
ncbi:MAG: ROK family protein [Clostridiales bacterium]|nr:ROK family protein [Clostridiales bacterium]